MNEIITTTLPALIEATTKKDIQTLASRLVNDIAEGWADALKMAEHISATEYLIKSIKEDECYVHYILEELAKHSGKYSHEGTRIEAAEVGVKYDYSACNDPVLKVLELELESIEKEITERKEFLKAVPVSGLIITDVDTGETLAVFRPNKTSISSYKVTLSK
jgi:hypothetical protein